MRHPPESISSISWIKWLLLSVITLGIYLLWVMPRVHRWVVEHTDDADGYAGRA